MTIGLTLCAAAVDELFREPIKQSIGTYGKNIYHRLGRWSRAVGGKSIDRREAQGVVLHARNEKRGREALDQAPGAETVVTGDLSSIEETKELASKVNALKERSMR